MDSLPNLQRFSTSYRQFIYAHHHNVLTEEDLQEYFPDEALFDTLANYRHHVSCLRGCHPDVRPFDQIFLDIAPLPLLVDCYFEYDKGYDIAPLWMVRVLISPPWGDDKLSDH